MEAITTVLVMYLPRMVPPGLGSVARATLDARRKRPVGGV
jgi:hypothetical protein